MKKAVAIILTIAFLLCMSTLPAVAADKARFELVAEEVTGSQTVDVALMIYNNPGITAFSVDITYPGEKLELLSVNGSGVYANGFSTGRIGSNPFKISWYSLSSANVLENGTAAVLHFQVLNLTDNAEVTLSYQEDDVFNSSFDNQFFEVKPAVIAMHTHVPAAAVQENVLAPGCTEPGSFEEVIYCSVCGVELSRQMQELPAAGHSYQTVINEEATCFRKGVKTLTCTVCSEEHREAIDFLPHQFTAQTVEPTCTQKGYTLYSCSNCDFAYKDNYVPMAEHSYVETVVEPTTQTQGYTVHTCHVCGYSYVDSITDVLPSEMNYIIPSLEEIQATLIIKNGDKEYTVTSENGVFNFNDVPEDTYKVYAKQKNSLTVCIGEYDTSLGEVIHHEPVNIPLGNFNDDDVINIDDIAILLQGDVFARNNTDFDLNDDGVIDMADLSVVLSAENFGRSSDI